MPPIVFRRRYLLPNPDRRPTEGQNWVMKLQTCCGFQGLVAPLSQGVGLWSPPVQPSCLPNTHH
jgi:hypothetical protein